MKDEDDIQTTDIFPVTKKRGRPSTGKALTSAERQAAYRKNKSTTGTLGGHNLNLWIDGGAKCALDRLCAHYGLSQTAMLESMIRDNDQFVISKLKDDKEGFHAYFL
jgi:hypothetical protein